MVQPGCGVNLAATAARDLRIKLSKRQREELVKRAAAGVPIAQLAADFGQMPEEVRRLVEEHRARQVAAVPEETFEQFLSRGDPDELTHADLMALAPKITASRENGRRRPRGYADWRPQAKFACKDVASLPRTEGEVH